MKHIVWILIAILTCSLASAAIVDSASLKVTLLNQEPTPVSPGNTVDVRFSIENDGGSVAPDVEFQVIPRYPFSLVDEGVRDLGTLTGGDSSEVTAREKFVLLVDPNAAPGDHEIEVRYRIGDGPWISNDDFTIEVRTRESILAINEVKSSPDRIVPGTKTKVSFTLENFAGNFVEDVKLTLDVFTTYVTTTGFSTQELPFTPLGSSNEKTVKKIAPGRSATIDFDLFTDADALSKAYKVPYVLTYGDETGNNFTREGVVGLVVDASPDVSVTLDSTEVLQDGAKGAITVKFVNKGFSDVKFLNVNLVETQEFDLLSNHEVYIGDLDSDDFETADFTILVERGEAGKMNLPLKISYRDANGGLFEEDITLSLELYSGKALKARSENGGGGFGGIIVIVIIIALGLYFYRKRKKKHAR